MKISRSGTIIVKNIVLIVCVVSLTILITKSFHTEFQNSIKNTVPATNSTGNMSFVSAKKQNLYLNDHVFRSIGVNRYNLLSYSNSSEKEGCANEFSEQEIDTMFSQLHTIGVTSIRFWMFQSFTKSGNDLTRFTYVISEAEKYNIKLIPVFENNLQDCTQGGMKNPDWYASGYLSPYGSYPLSLKEYIGRIVSVYKNNSNIMMWQIMNEAQDQDEYGLYNFAKDISGYIKSIDTNHLISLGLTGTNESTTDYRNIHSISTIDVLDYHDYNNNTDSIPNNLLNRFTDSDMLQKPLVVTEAGIQSDVSNRSDLFQSKIQSFFKRGGAAYLIWSYGTQDMTNDGYNFDFSDAVAQVVSNTAIDIAK